MEVTVPTKRTIVDIANNHIVSLTGLEPINYLVFLSRVSTPKPPSPSEVRGR